MRKLVLLMPPDGCDAIDAETAQFQLEQLAKRGLDVETIILSPGWRREIVEAEDIVVRLKEHE